MLIAVGGSVKCRRLDSHAALTFLPGDIGGMRLVHLGLRRTNAVSALTSLVVVVVLRRVEKPADPGQQYFGSKRFVNKE